MPRCRRILRQQKPPGNQRSDSVVDALKNSGAVAVQRLDARPAVATRSSLRSGLRQRDEGPAKAYQAIRARRHFGAELPGIIGRQRCQDLDASDSADLVAERINA